MPILRSDPHHFDGSAAASVSSFAGWGTAFLHCPEELVSRDQSS